MQNFDMKTVSPEILQTIKGVHVDYFNAPDHYVTRVQDFIENWLFEGGIEIEQWRVDEERCIDPGEEISMEEAIRRAVVQLGYLYFLEIEADDSDWSESVSVSPIT